MIFKKFWFLDIISALCSIPIFVKKCFWVVKLFFKSPIFFAKLLFILATTAADGKFLALKCDNISNVGAHCVSLSPLGKGSGLITGSYHIPTAMLRARAVFTNTMSTQAYRSSGRPEVTYAIERIIEIELQCKLPIIKAFGINTMDDQEQVNAYHDFAEFFLFDSKPSSTEIPGGNAKQFDWSMINKSRINKQFFLSGGLNIDNIKDATNTEITNLFDVSSGVESNPGVKDSDKLKKFIDLIKN